ncbi:MAG: hypothetical protein ABSH47_10265 [Bryobacteraceae bacterium]|jgi:hypothetical protein
MRHTFGVILLLLFAPSLMAQRAFELAGKVIYEDARGSRTDLGAGFSPVLTHDGRVALLRGRSFDYGEQFDCAHRETRNWVAVYNPATKSEEVLFDRPVAFGGGKWKFCVFWRMQLSPDDSIVYLVSPVSATSGSLAIVRLHSGRISEVGGVDEVFVIETGPHRGDLIYQRRMWHRIRGEEGQYPYYPFVHARADGSPIHVISGEYFTVGGATDTPILKAYLRRIGGVIRVNGKTFP